MDKPKFVPVDLTQLMTDGVLAAVNEVLLWPFGLALTWDVPDGHPEGPATKLHVREWQYEDGHHEGIAMYATDPVIVERHERFAAWAAARIATMPEEERPRAEEALWALSLLRSKMPVLGDER
jgi:hypothetical protein